MKKLRVRSLALFLALLCACAPAAPSASAPPPEPTPEPEPIWGSRVFAHDFTAGDQTVVLSASYTLPTIENTGPTPGWRAVNDWYATEGEALLENAAELAGWAVDDYLSSGAVGAEFVAHADTQTFMITRNSDRYLSVLRTHVMQADSEPVSFYFTDLFDLNTGERLTLAQCFTLSDEGAHALVLEQVLALSGEGAYGDAAFSREELEELFDPSLFYFSGDGLVIPLQAHHAGRSVSLLPDRAIPYYELEDVLAIW